MCVCFFFCCVIAYVRARSDRQTACCVFTYTRVRDTRVARAERRRSFMCVYVPTPVVQLNLTKYLCTSTIARPCDRTNALILCSNILASPSRQRTHTMCVWCVCVHHRVSQSNMHVARRWRACLRSHRCAGAKPRCIGRYRQCTSKCPSPARPRRDHDAAQIRDIYIYI